MKILNIDALVTPKRQINFGGVTHAVSEISAQQFVDSLAKSEALEKAGSEMAPSEAFAENVQMVLDLVPSVPREVLMSLPLNAVIAMLKFCRGDDEGLVLEDAKEGEGSDAPKPT